MDNYQLHAIRELKILGYKFDDDGYPIEDSDEDFDMNAEICMCIMEILEVFAKQGHSGSSASYAISILEKVLRFEPVTPLTGNDDEWNEIGDQNGTLYQNNRCSHVFKDDNGAYDIDGKVFWEWHIDDDGRRYKSHYTCRESRVPVEFPYTPKTEYVHVDEDGNVIEDSTEE